MLLRQIKFYNFRGFKGEHILDLSCKDDKNVIVILGDNTWGKSTFVQAFAWCFYGLKNFANPEIIYNKEVAEEANIQSTIDVYVEVEFEHNKTIYTARRQLKYFKNINGSVVQNGENFTLIKLDNKTGQTIRCGYTPTELKEAMNALLPQDLSEFFFFEGEKRNEISAKNLGKAVKTLMGIEAYQKMKEHLWGDNLSNAMSSKSVIYKFKNMCIDANSLSLDKINKEIETNEREIENVEKLINDYNDQEEKYKSRINEIKDILSSLSETKKLQSERAFCEQEIKDLKDDLAKGYKRYFENIENNSADLLLMPIIKRAEKRLDQMDISDKGIPSIEGPAITALLHRGYCLCGTELKEGSLAYKTVENYLNILPPAQIGTIVKEFKDNFVETNYKGKNFAKSIDDDNNYILNTIIKIDRSERRLQDISNQLKSSNNVNISQYENDLREYNIRLQEIRENIISARVKKERLEEQISKSNIERNQLAHKSKVNQRNKLYYSYAYEVYNWVKKEYDRREKLTKENLQTNVENLFNNIYVGKRKVNIDNEYNMTLDPPADTGSLKTIQYFSYIGGIVKLASDTMNEKNNTGLGEEYPLVLDAAFSTTDTTHTKLIAKRLSEVTNQLIFAVMDKDWKYVDADMSNKIAKRYRLAKINENSITIKEEV